MSDRSMHFLSLPSVMLEHILSYLSYDHVAKNRIVCKDFNIACQNVLNRGFQMIERQISTNLRAKKAQLPRRESERRFHPLSRRCDILNSVETRVSMLNMTYSRFIEQGKCCFIPGKILDELLHVMNIIDVSDPLPMSFEILQELRDISGMAIDHFEEVVAPRLRQQNEDYNSKQSPILQSPNTVTTSLELAVLREVLLRNHKRVSKIEKKFVVLCGKIELYRRLMLQSKRQLLQKQIEQNHKIAELKRKLEEYEIKFKELSIATNYKNSFKESDIRNKNYSLSDNALKLRLKNFSSQIKLDPSPLNIGLNKGRRGSPITKPRKASLVPPLHKLSGELLNNSLSSTSNALIKNLTMGKKSSDKDDQSMKILSKNTIYKKKLNSESKFLNNYSLKMLQQIKEALKDTSNIKLVKKKDKRTTDGIQNSSKEISLPSTSKNILSESFENEYDDIVNRKRTFDDEDEDCSHISDDSNAGNGFQAKVQILHRTIMKLLESLSDNTSAKRRRLENLQE